MKGMFSKSNRFKEIIEKTGWTLYDITNRHDTNYCIDWEYLEERKPAEQFEIGHNYLFVPRLKIGQTIREAYSSTNGLGPSLIIKNSKNSRWVSLEIQEYLAQERGKQVPFNRLDFTRPWAVAFNNGGSHSSNTILIRYCHLVDTFERYFRIITPVEYEKIIPVGKL